MQISKRLANNYVISETCFNSTTLFNSTPKKTLGHFKLDVPAK